MEEAAFTTPVVSVWKQPGGWVWSAHAPDTSGAHPRRRGWPVRCSGASSTSAHARPCRTCCGST
eukprot:250063-Pyramimonas_sp.AAC.2